MGTKYTEIEMKAFKKLDHPEEGVVCPRCGNGKSEEVTNYGHLPLHQFPGDSGVFEKNRVQF